MFADSYKLMAVFSISYKPNKMIYNNLRKINPDHFEMMILTRDYNITSDLLAELYDADPHNFKIANKEEFERLYHHDEVKDKYPAGIYSITGAGGITAALAQLPQAHYLRKGLGDYPDSRAVAGRCRIPCAHCADAEYGYGVCACKDVVFPLPLDTSRSVHLHLLRLMNRENITLIGMPGAGKSTIAFCLQKQWVMTLSIPTC